MGGFAALGGLAAFALWFAACQSTTATKQAEQNPFASFMGIAFRGFGFAGVVSARLGDLA
jgi:hypothetical protein